MVVAPDAAIAPSVAVGASAPPLTVKSVVVEGSTSTFWFGTARGVSMGPKPPAATAALAGSVVAGAAGAAALSSSSQSISSSAAPETKVISFLGCGAGASMGVTYQYHQLSCHPPVVLR